MVKSDLPFGSEFTPSKIHLKDVLELAKKHAEDWRGFEKAVKHRYFARNDTSEYNRGKLANNLKLALIAYGIIDREVNFTGFGKLLYSLRANDELLHEELAKHILLNLHGANLVQCVLDMQTAGETVDLITLREWLEDRGIHFPRGGKHPSMMRLWLEKAGIFADGWRIDQRRLKKIMGITPDELDALAVLSPEQRAFLKTLMNMGGAGPYPSNEIEKLAATTYGIRYNEKNLPKSVLYPLEEKGYISLERGTRQEGRGAKPFTVRPTEKLAAEIFVPLLDQIEKMTGSDLRPLLRKPLAEILGELESEDKHIAGLALEALAFKLMRLVDLDYVATRLRGAATGGAEVDLIFESTRLVFSRWQIQCKNTARVSLDDVAKEVGLTHLLKSNVVVIVSTGQIGPEARKYANKIMTDSNLCVVMIDRDDIMGIQNNPASIVEVFGREAERAMEIKRIEM